MELKHPVEALAEEQGTAEAMSHCPVCKSQMVPSNGVKVICIACGFEEIPSD